MQRHIKIQTILNDIGITTAAFTAAVTDIITDTAHGLVDGNMIVLTTTDTLPAGLATATVYYVVQATTNTFKVSIAPGTEGQVVNITDTGTGTHTWTMHDIGTDLLVQDYRNVILIVATDGGGDAALTVKFQGSMQDTLPDFSAAQSVTNMWDYVDVVDLEDQSSVDGDTGIAASAADVYRQFEMNTNAVKWINCIISGWTVGEVTVKALLANNQ